MLLPPGHLLPLLGLLGHVGHMLFPHLMVMELGHLGGHVLLPLLSVHLLPSQQQQHHQHVQQREDVNNKQKQKIRFLTFSRLLKHFFKTSLASELLKLCV